MVMVHAVYLLASEKGNKTYSKSSYDFLRGLSNKLVVNLPSIYNRVFAEHFKYRLVECSRVFVDTLIDQVY